MASLKEEPGSACGPVMSVVFDTILTTIPVQLNLSASFGGRQDEGRAGWIAAVAGLAENVVIVTPSHAGRSAIY